MPLWMYLCVLLKMIEYDLPLDQKYSSSNEKRHVNTHNLIRMHKP